MEHYPSYFAIDEKSLHQDSTNKLFSVQRNWFQDIKRMNFLSLRTTFETFITYDDPSFIEVKNRGFKFFSTYFEMEGSACRELFKNKDTLKRKWEEITKDLTGFNEPEELKEVKMRNLLIIMTLWASFSVESEAEAFIASVVLRFLEYHFSVGFLKGPNNDEWTHVQILYKVWVVIQALKSLQHEYLRLLKTSKMEKTASFVVEKLEKSWLFSKQILALSNGTFYRCENLPWSTGVLQKRKSSEILFCFLALPDDLATIDGEGGCLLTERHMDGRKTWKTQQKIEAEDVIRKYQLDKDGNYYRTFGWRSIIVYFGTIGALAFSGVVTILDLGDEGDNIFKRINFFCHSGCINGFIHIRNVQSI